MSVIIRLQNLPLSANALDIRQYFQGLAIPEGGVHIVGGELGDAFIAFSTDEDARQAMLIDGGKIKEVKIKLYLSSRTEMQKVIEVARAQSLNLQSFMQMCAPLVIPQVTVPQGPVLPILNQVPAKVTTPEVKTPVHQTPLTQPPIPQSSLLQPPLPLVSQPAIPQPTFSQTSVTAPVEKKPVINPNSESESKDVDAESTSGKDRRERRDRQRSRSLSRDKSRDYSRDRSKSHDRRDFRSRDRYRDRRRRDRSRSRDRRRRNRDRSRSKERSSRRSSREKRKDSDKTTTNTETDKINTTKQSSVEKKITSQIPLPEAQKPGFTSSNWVTVSDNKSNILPKPQIPLAKPPMPPELPQTPKQMLEEGEINSKSSVDHDGRPPVGLLENSLISRQASTLQRRADLFPPIMGIQKKDDVPHLHLPQENWPLIRPPADMNRLSNTDKDRMMPVMPLFGNHSMDIMERRNIPPPNNSLRVENRIEDNFNRGNYLPQNSKDNFQNMYQNKPDLRMLNNFNAPPERFNFGTDMLPIEREGYRPGPLVDRPNFRQDPPIDRGNYRPDLQSIERPGYRQEVVNERGSYRQDPVNERGILKQEPLSERNQRQETPVERTNFLQNIPNERGNYRPESVEGSRQDRPYPNNDRFSQMDRPDRLSPYAQRQYNQRGKYNNSCIEVRNMSPTTSYGDIRRFFHGLYIPSDGIKMINDCQGNRIGIAYIRFAKSYCKVQALKKNGSYLKNTVVEVLNINDDLFDKADDSVFDSRSKLLDNKDRYDMSGEEISTDEFLALAIREFPPYTKEKDIQNIFSAWKLADCFLLPKSGRRNASAYVKFCSMDDARKALAATSRFVIGNRKIHVSICYDHEFQDARDIKNMEEDEEDRLVIDTKDEISMKSNDLRSPPKDPRKESKINNAKLAELNKVVGPAVKKMEFQKESQQSKTITYTEQRKCDSKLSEHNPQEPKQIPPTQPQVDNPEQMQDSKQRDQTQPNIDYSNKKELKVSVMELEETQSEKSLPSSSVDISGSVASEASGQRGLLPTPSMRSSINNLPSVTEGETSMDTVESDERKSRSSTDCIILRGLPFQANDRDIIAFFGEEEVVPTQIHIMLDKMGHPSGDAFCEFSSQEEAEYALQKDSTPLGRSLISVLPVSREEMCEALGMTSSPDRQMFPNSFPPRPLLGRGGIRGRFRPNFQPYPYHYEQHRVPPLMGYDHRREMMLKQRHEEDVDRGPSVDSFGKPGCVIALENVPFKADVDEIIDFFRGFNVTRENVIRRYSEQGLPTGDARVSLSSPLEAQRALKILSHKQIRHRQIYMHLLS